MTFRDVVLLQRHCARVGDVGEDVLYRGLLYWSPLPSCDSAPRKCIGDGVGRFSGKVSPEYLLDDLALGRNDAEHLARSKKVELLAPLYNHDKKEFSYGFRMLTLCWSDGNTLLPVSHTLLSTENTKNRLREASRKAAARSNAGKQRKLAQQKATEVMLQLLQEAKAIYKQHRKRRGRSKYLLSVQAAVVKGEESLPVRLVFVRNRNHRKDWLVLVTTDMSLTAEEVIRIYGKRWGIEVFFKVCKSFLRLEKDCRSLSYDAMTAHVSIVFTRYVFLAVEQRECKNARSLGELFYLSVDELPDVCFVEAMRLLLLLFVERLQEKPMLDEGEIQGQLQGFLKELPVLLSQKLRKCA